MQSNTFSQVFEVTIHKLICGYDLDALSQKRTVPVLRGIVLRTLTFSPNASRWCLIASSHLACYGNHHGQMNQMMSSNNLQLYLHRRP